MPKREQRPHAPEELVEGYAYAAALAEQRRDRVMAWGDTKEAAAWGKIATYCRMMAECKYVDAPDSLVAYVPPADTTVLNLRVLERILDRSGEESSKSWTVEKQMALTAALHVLSATERVIAEMYYGGLLDVAHIARALNTTSGTVETFLDRIRKKWSRIRYEMQLTHTNPAG